MIPRCSPTGSVVAQKRLSLPPLPADSKIPITVLQSRQWFSMGTTALSYRTPNESRSLCRDCLMNKGQVSGDHFDQSNDRI